MTSYFLRTLFVQTPGTRLILDGDAVKALQEEAAPRRLPLNALDAIVVLSGIDVSTPLLVRCAEDGRTVAFLGRFGRPKAIVEGATSGRGGLRRRQFLRHFDSELRTACARSIVEGKLGQLTWAIRQWARDASAETAPKLRTIATEIDSYIEAIGRADRATLLGIEGNATRNYFVALDLALRNRTFPGRSRRPPTDPVNAVMSFLYGMLRSAVHGALHAAGLDPYCGYLHGDADSQPSLVLDLMEEFRPEMDRLCVRLFNLGRLADGDFETDVSGAVSLNDVGRQIVLDDLQRHRSMDVTLQGSVGPIPNAALPLVQAYAFANSLRSESIYRAHRRKLQ